MSDPKQILIRILEIIGYSEDKDKFATEFLQNVSLQSLLDLFNTLPQDKKDQLQKDVSLVGNDPQKLQGILKNYFTEEQINTALQNSSKNAITEYIKTIEPTLSDPQKQSLANYFSEITKNTSPATA